ncbi:DcaP family trimeric outer membrane transporter [Glaciecola sp. 2405UD65-10]|uniref:DcaP family trimeric outer membrane transporter n=1 Tax=Glaciecola sp. 2405UD65-10 TaxID=3397244 RepID=UPI003B591516
MNSHKKFARTALATACCFVFAPVALAGVELVNVTNAQGTTKVTMGGYAKVDVRHVSGDVAYQDYWLGNFPGGVATDTSHTGFNVRESRLNFKVQHNDISAVVEMDFYGGDGNEVVSNSTNPRLRHFYINYKNWMIGQNWSTFMPLAALPEALDFGGPHVGEVFIRQTQIRYTTGNWQFAIENPETNGDGDNGTSSSAVGVTGANADKDESIPDFVARYNHKADWGQVSVGTLFRKVDQGGIDETAIAANVSGRIKTVGKDDFRFQISVGEPGRYVSAALTPDIVLNADEQTVVEETTAFTVAYRHFWNESTRSTIFYGAAETDTLERKRNHVGVNLITDVAPQLNVGVELGRYAIEDESIADIDSTYLQFSAKYAF